MGREDAMMEGWLVGNKGATRTASTVCCLINGRLSQIRDDCSASTVFCLINGRRSEIRFACPLGALFFCFSRSFRKWGQLLGTSCEHCRARLDVKTPGGEPCYLCAGGHAVLVRFQVRYRDFAL